MSWRATKDGEGVLTLDPAGEVDVVGEIAESLRGQCQDSLMDVLERHGMEHLEADEAFTGAIDAEVFECEQCNWWCEWSEESESTPGSCTDCAPDEDY